VWESAIFVVRGCPAEDGSRDRGWRDSRVVPEWVLGVVNAAL
jgi:hypothetical protein